MELETKVAVIAADLLSHVKSDDERYNRIDTHMANIARDVALFGDRLEKGFTRVHERIDEEAGKGRHNLANQMQTAYGDLREETKRATNAEGELETSVTALEKDAQNYIQKVMWAALGMAGSSIVYLLVYGPPWIEKP